MDWSMHLFKPVVMGMSTVDEIKMVTQRERPETKSQQLRQRGTQTAVHKYGKKKKKRMEGVMGGGRGMCTYV